VVRAQATVGRGVPELLDVHLAREELILAILRPQHLRPPQSKLASHLEEAVARSGKNESQVTAHLSPGRTIEQPVSVLCSDHPVGSGNQISRYTMNRSVQQTRQLFPVPNDKSQAASGFARRRTLPPGACERFDRISLGGVEHLTQSLQPAAQAF
jgi:hypothetical protein